MVDAEKLRDQLLALADQLKPVDVKIPTQTISLHNAFQRIKSTTISDHRSLEIQLSSNDGELSITFRIWDGANIDAGNSLEEAILKHEARLTKFEKASLPDVQKLIDNASEEPF